MDGINESGLSIQKLCDRVGMSRQNYYSARQLRTRREVDEQFILEQVRAERSSQPRLGTRKLLHMLGPVLREVGIKIGRDRFYKLLKERGLTLKPKCKRPRTTNSRHSLPVFLNLLSGKEFCRAHELWVSDITYIRTLEGYLYAALIMDAVSRKIVGFDIGDSLEVEGCLRALDLALEQLPEGKRPIHHSDRGCQYCSHAYVNKLQAHHLSVSMTQVMHCYENAQAERLNGILKHEYELDAEFGSKEQAKRAFRQAVDLYNDRRPHQALGYKVPAVAHEEVA
jgi:putative transposase